MKYTYKTYSYSRRTPQVRMQRLVTGLLPYPGPVAPVTDFTIAGQVTRDGTVAVGIPIEFTALGTVVTNSSGNYVQSAAAGYSGSAIPHYSAGSFVPASRSYSNLAANQTGQNYALYLPQSSEYVVLIRSGSTALTFSVVTTTGYYAVQDFFGNVTIHANGQTGLAFANESATVWPCFSASDAFRYGSIVDLNGDTAGISGFLDISLLVGLVHLAVSTSELTDLIISSSQTQLTQVYVYNNNMGSIAVNAILIGLDSTGATGGIVDLTGNAAPTSSGNTAKTSLQGKGWTVYTD